MKPSRRTFVDRCLTGDSDPAAIGEAVTRWSSAPVRMPLREWLGLADDEFELWEANPGALRYLLHARATGAPLDHVARVIDGRDPGGLALAATIADPLDVADLAAAIDRDGAS